MTLTKFIFSSFLILSGLRGFGQAVDSMAVDKIVWDGESEKLSNPGLAVGVYKNGRLIYGKGYGMANMEKISPITTQSVFDIASVSKQFTAACILILMNRGVLRLDDTVTKFFPSFPGYGNQITINHLLHHTSGLRDYNSIAELKGLTRKDLYPQKEVMKWLIRQKELNTIPGEEYIYCNSGYWLLGQIVEQVSDKSLADFARDEIFKPLGMRHTYYSNEGRQGLNYAVGYTISAVDTINDYEVRDSEQETSGAGGVYTSIEDMAKWDEAFDDSTRLGSFFQKQMIEPGVLNNGYVLDYGCGLFLIHYRGLKVIGHNGSSGSFSGHRAQFIRFPDQHLSIAIFTNRSDIAPWALSGKIAGLFLKDQFVIDEKPTDSSTVRNTIKLSRKEQESLTGYYWSAQNASSCKVYVKNDTLWSNDEMEGEKILIPISSTMFHEKGKTNSIIKFVRMNDQLFQMEKEMDGKRTDQLIYYTPKTYSKEELRLLVGNYYSEELETNYQLKLVESNLFLFINNKKIAQIDPKSKDIISTGDASIYFQKNSKGKITGFTLSYFRINNIHFKKENNEKHR